MQTKMFRLPGAIAIATALLCALAPPLDAKDQNLNPRPIKGTGLMVLTVTPSLTSPIAPLRVEESGNATHLGLYSSVAEGTMNLATGEILRVEGVTTAANGKDTINWVYQGGTTVISGGTGRFENASWSFVPNVVSLSAPVFNPDGTFTIYMVYTVDTEGTF